jgi:peptidoglycan/xylan/chitin deacetylase (PgdA/CDA1 family)
MSHSSRFAIQSAVRLLSGVAFLVLPAMCAAQKLAITFDDLPQNGGLPPNVTRTEITRKTLAVLKKHHLPPVYGFINAKKLEGTPDGAEALKLWAAAEPVGNHTYSHMNLEENTPEAFERDVEQNEPVLELLTSTGDWHWLRYPYLHEGDTVEKRRAVRDYLKMHNYKIAQVTVDWEDYLWNTAYARCVTTNDDKSIAWLKSSYMSTASAYIDLSRDMSKLIFGHDINHVLLLHLGAFSSTIVPDALELLKKKGFKFVTLEEAESDPAYQTDPDIGLHDAGTLLDQMMQVRQIKYPTVLEKPYEQLKTICQ